MLTAANLMIHLPPAPSPKHMHALVKVYYIARDKATGQPTQLRVSFMLRCFRIKNNELEVSLGRAEK